MIAVAAVALVAGVAGAALATTSSASSASATDAAATPTPTPSASGHWPGARGPMGGPFHGAPFHGALFNRGGFFAGPGGVVHGQVVVPAAGGKFRTEDIQTGKVTAVSGASLTVRSADGFTKSYRVTGATQVDAGKTGIGSVKVGNQVAVTATVSGPTASLTRVIDLSLLGGGRFAPGRGHQPSAAS
jgi:hypothetical protein